MKDLPPRVFAFISTIAMSKFQIAHPRWGADTLPIWHPSLQYRAIQIQHRQAFGVAGISVSAYLLSPSVGSASFEGSSESGVGVSSEDDANWYRARSPCGARPEPTMRV